MFNYLTGDPICPACKTLAEDEFQKVKKYVSDNKQATIPEIVKECEVDARQIQQWIREERLFFADDSPVKISCEICGCQISTGRYCDKCKKDTANSFSNASRRPEAPKPEAPASSNSRGAVMHTFKNF